MLIIIIIILNDVSFIFKNYILNVTHEKKKMF